MAKTLLEAVNIEVRRGMGVVLSNHNLVAKQGEVVVLEGANGSGKSTLIEAIARLLPIEKGHVNHGEMLVVDHEGRRLYLPRGLGISKTTRGRIYRFTPRDSQALSKFHPGFRRERKSK